MDAPTLTERTRADIQALSVEELLRQVRFAPPGDPYMQGEVGKFWLATLAEKRAQNPGEYVRASKKLGW